MSLLVIMVVRYTVYRPGRIVRQGGQFAPGIPAKESDMMITRKKIKQAESTMKGTAMVALLALIVAVVALGVAVGGR